MLLTNRSGKQLITSKYIRRSNFLLSIKRGFLIYCWATQDICRSWTSARRFVRKIPLPWAAPSGLIMKGCLLRPLTNIDFNAAKLCGKMNVTGKKLYSRGNFCLINSRFCASLVLRQMFVMPGKWFILCHRCSVRNSLSLANDLSTQITSQFFLTLSGADSSISFHPNDDADRLTTE